MFLALASTTQKFIDPYDWFGSDSGFERKFPRSQLFITVQTACRNRRWVSLVPGWSPVSLKWWQGPGAD
jgi:hypothetical protein